MITIETVLTAPVLMAVVMSDEELAVGAVVFVSSDRLSWSDKPFRVLVRQSMRYVLQDVETIGELELLGAPVGTGYSALPRVTGSGIGEHP